jgi:hypothetical protein
MAATLRATRTPPVLRAVLLVHGVITLAGAVVLTVTPTVIPAAVGIAVERPDYLIVYLVAAAELAASVLSFGAARLTDPAALRLVVVTFVVLHGASGVLDVVYMAVTDVSAVLAVNTCLRAAAALAFVIAWRVSRPHQTYGTTR